MTLRFDAGFDVTAFGSLRISNFATNANITTGKFCHVDLSSFYEVGVYGDFASQVNAALFAAGINAVVTYVASLGRYRISAGASPLNITAGVDEANAAHARMGQVLGFSTSPGAIAAGASATGDIVPFFAIHGEMGGMTDDSDIFEGGESEEAEAEDGTSYATAPTSAPQYRNWTVSYEPRSAVYIVDAEPEAAWTWEHFYQHLRCVHPFAVTDDFGQTTVCKLKANADRFRPKRVNANWNQRFNIEMRTRVLGVL